MTTNRGTGAVRTAARDESTLVSANVISTNGSAMPNKPTTLMWA